MIAQPPHNRKLGLSGITLTEQKNNRHDAKALTAVRDPVEKVMIESRYLEGAPFSWVTIAVRYGLKNDDKPRKRPNRKLKKKIVSRWKKKICDERESLTPDAKRMLRNVSR